MGASLMTPSLVSFLCAATALLNKHEPDRAVIDLLNTSIISHSRGLQVWIQTDDSPLTVGGRLSPCQLRVQPSHSGLKITGNAHLKCTCDMRRLMGGWASWGILTLSCLWSDMRSHAQEIWERPCPEQVAFSIQSDFTHG